MLLVADGGGVRGLSSLLILQRLMQQINSSIEEARQNDPDKEPHQEVQPHEIFDLVAGTSTGGLIAIMLGKLGMNIEECIRTYHDLSTRIFGKKHFRGKLTGGLGPTRYSGMRLRTCIRDLIQRQRGNADLPMICSDDSDRIAW
jgi:patatin-like phospholipase/acyl hydrolase